MKELTACCGLDCETCGDCPELDACPTVAGILSTNPPARDRLRNG